MTRTITRLTTALAIGAGVLSAAGAADARGSYFGSRYAAPASVVVRDHRTPAPTIVRDHRTPAPVVVRDHRGSHGAAPGGVSVTAMPGRRSGRTRACLGGYCVPVPSVSLPRLPGFF